MSFKLEKEGKTQVQIAKEVKFTQQYVSQLLEKYNKSDGPTDSLYSEFHQQGYSQLSQIENKAISTIRDTIKLLDVPKEVQKAIEKEK